MSAITPTRVLEIVALDEQPVLRNLLITDAYHRLTVDMAALLGGPDLAWPVFATWASKQAGTFIRRDELSPRVRAMLDELEPERLRMVRAILDGVARFIVGGNTIVFEELGLAFARFVELFRDPRGRTQTQLETFVAGFRPGAAEPDRVEIGPGGELLREQAGGQDLLRAGMTHAFEALHETEPDARAELLLLASIECGLHEQIRLQPYIAGALDAPLELVLRLCSSRLGPEVAPLLAIVRRVATELMMTLECPGEVLYLGTDLPAPPGQPMWPLALTELRHPTLLGLAARVGAYEIRERDLDLADRVEGWALELLSRIELARIEAQGSAARDWARLDDRMRYIFEYFRSRQQHRVLLTPPFSPAQQLELLAGRVPAGPL